KPVAAAGNLVFTWTAATSVTIASGAFITTGTNTANNITWGIAGSQWTLPAPAAPFTGETIVFTDKGTTSNRFDATIIGSGSLVVAGTSATMPIAFNNSNTYSGGTILVAGTLNINQNDGLSNGAVTFAGGSLAASRALGAVTNTVNIPNTTATIAGSVLVVA